MIFISGFVETPPPIPGGLWSWDGEQLRQVYDGGGVFGLTWWQDGTILIGGTRDDEKPLVAFLRRNTQLVPIPVRYEQFVHGRRVHGIAADEQRLYVVAAQGDPDAAVCTNQDRWRDSRVGKVLISDLTFASDGLLVSHTRVWNPFECDHHHHYNDAAVDSEFIYLVSFSRCDESKTMIDRGGIARFRKNSLQLDGVITDGLNMPHSIEFWGDRMFTCSSGDSSVLSVSANSDVANPRLEYKGINNFVRGLAVSDQYFYVGLSESAGRADPGPFTESIRGFLQFSRGTGDTLHVNLPESCQNVYSILKLPEAPAARIGSDDPGPGALFVRR